MMDVPRYKRLLILGLITMFTASCGNSSDDDKPQEPKENIVPVVNSTSIDTATVGELYSYTLAASDDDGDTLTMSFTSLPAWLTFNASSGELTGTPSGTNVGNHNVLLAVSDGIDSVSQSFVIVVTAASDDGSSDWALVWSDEFEGTSIDASKWAHEVNCNGGGNQEKQCYTDSTENSFVENGILKIVAKAESGQSLPYSSARLISKDKGDWKYGRFEIRAKAPTGQGSWPAIWMLPTDNVYGGWPHSGEIDIFESVNLGVALNDGSGGVESNVHGTLHYGESWPNNDNTGQSYLLPSGENPADDFHIYAIEWEEGEIRWYVDGILYQTQRQSEVTVNSDGNADGLSHKGWYTEDNGEILWSSAPFDERFHLLLNFAVGGSWPEAVNQGGVDASAFGASNSFEVDYVRVYECSISPNNGQGCATVTDNYSDPIADGGTLVNGAAPTPVAPSDGVVRELTIFANAINAAWPAWDSSGSSTPTVESDDAAYGEVVEFSVGSSPAVFGFNTSISDSPSPYDGSPLLNNGVLEFDLKLVTPPNNASAGWNLKVEQGGTSSEAVVSLNTPTANWQHYAVPLKDLSNAGLDLNGIDIVMIFPDWGEGEGAVFRVDNVTILQGEGEPDPDPTPSEELLTNGSFETGTDGWIGAVNVVMEAGNNIFQADVAVAGNPSDVNLSQVMTLVPNETYVVSFKAKASIALSIIVGLGLNQDPWTNSTDTVALTTEWQTFTYEITATDFGDENSRVLFDLGSEVGTVSIDDVSVVINNQNSGGPVAEDEFILISSTVASSIEFEPDTVGEWSTGSQIQGDVMFDGLLGWEVTSSSNSPEQGNWGTVLAFQNGIVGDFSLHNRITLKLATTGNYSGGYKIAISASGVNLEVALPIDETITTWQSVSLNTLDIPLNMSSIDWIAVYGIGGQMGVSTIHLTDFSIIKDEAISFDSNTKDDFVFISSDENITSDLIVDDDNNSDVGNVIFGEWSTGTGISDVTYSGLDAIQLSAGGSWGAVLALQGDISDGTSIDNYDVDFAEYTNIKFKMASQGAFERYAVSIVSRIGDNEAVQEVSFSLINQSEWNTIDIDLARYGVNISNVSQMALFGVYEGGSAAQQIYITDLVMYDSGKVVISKDSSDDKFVFFSSTGETTDMVFDEDNFVHNGNMTIGEWSTGTALASDVTYNGLNAFELTRGSGSWGAVLALMGDIHGDVQEYDFDVAEYSTLNFKIAAIGGMTEYTLDFIVNGSEFKIPLSVNSNWSEVSINLADVPLNLSKLTQIAIFGVGGGAGDKIYVTDMNISK